MKITNLILLLYFLSFKLLGQSPRFFDSLNFFARTKTKEIHVSQRSNGKAFRVTTAHFNKQKHSLVWCGKHVGAALACADTVYFDPTTGNAQTDSTYHHVWDNKQRLTKTIQRADPDETITTHYYYTDSLSKRLKMVIEESSNGHTSISLYQYGMDQLKTVYESIYGPNRGNSKFETHRTYTYSYYPDARVKTETVETNGKPDFISEFRYVETE